MICGNVDINGRKTYIEITEDVNIRNLVGSITKYYIKNFFRFTILEVRVKGIDIIDQEFKDYKIQIEKECYPAFYTDDIILKLRNGFIPTKEPIKAKIKRIIEEFRK